MNNTRYQHGKSAATQLGAKETRLGATRRRGVYPTKVSDVGLQAGSLPKGGDPVNIDQVKRIGASVGCFSRNKCSHYTSTDC
jgi:hypothetical protein